MEEGGTSIDQMMDRNKKKSYLRALLSVPF